MKFKTENRLNIFNGKSAFFACLFLVCALLPFSSEAATIGKPVSNLSLVGHWSFDEGTSTIAHDLSGNGRHGTFSGAPEWVGGKKGKALDFDGVDDYVITTANRGSYSAITVSAWFRFEGSVSDSYRAIISGQSADFFIGKNTGNSNIGIQDGSYNSAMAVGTNAWDGAWHHIAYTFSGGTGTVYLDGVSVGSGAFSGGTGAIWIGQENEGAGYDFNGKIDDVRFYSRALSPAEIAALYSSVQSSHAATTKTGLVAYYSLNEGSGTVAHDQSGSANIGTIQNGPSWVSGKQGAALSFDGTDDRVDIPNLATQVTGSFTISFWAKVLSDQPNERQFFSAFVSSANEIGVSVSDANKFRFYTGGPSSSNNIFDSTGDVSLNRWYHITMVYDDTTKVKSRYIDGVFEASVSTVNSIPWPSVPAYISHITSQSRQINAIIDDFRIYNRALSAAEITSLYGYKETVVNQSQNNKLTNGLVGYWTFNGQDTLTTITDVSGQSNHGYFVGGATSTAKVVGRVGQALRFDGVNDYIPTASRAINGSGHFTFSAWVKYERTSSTYEVPIWNGVDSTTGGFGFGYRKPNSRVLGAGWGSSNGEILGITSENGVWYHVASTYDGATHTFYVNGVSQGTAPFSTSNFTSGVTTLGNLTSGNSYWFQGSSDEIRAYNRALSAAEVKQLYNMGR